VDTKVAGLWQLKRWDSPDGYSVVGFLGQRNSTSGVYLHQFDYQHRVHENSVTVALPNGTAAMGDCKNQTLVLMSGVFHEARDTQNESIGGSLNVVSCAPWTFVRERGFIYGY
jgi:hypothetical protein